MWIIVSSIWNDESRPVFEDFVFHSRFAAEEVKKNIEREGTHVGVKFEVKKVEVMK